MIASCSNCKFSEFNYKEQEITQYVNKYLLKCIRYPPKISGDKISEFPVVEEDMVCGEWKFKEG